MADEIKSIRLVVANTGPIVAALLGECLETLPLALEKIHIPVAELEEWKQTLAEANQKLPPVKQVEILSLLGGWTQRGILGLHQLTPAQEERAKTMTAKIHPEWKAGERASVDGAAIVLARTLIDLGEAQALLADERKLRACARDEGVETVGSIWLFCRLYEVGGLDFETALNAPHLARARGQHYAGTLISEFSATLTQIRDRQVHSRDR